MLPQQDLEFLQTMFDAALEAARAYVTPSTPWPLNITMQEYAQCAACESAEETGWGKSLPKGSNNYLGIKATKSWTGPVVGASGTEQNPDGSWTGPQADLWRVYANPQACFADQLHILATAKNPDGSLIYAQALAAETPEDYITAECAKWSTGLAKGQQVTIIYDNHGKMSGQGDG